MEVTDGELFGRPFRIITAYPHRTVLCDLCNTDYTDRADEGGILFGSKAICPVCAPRTIENAAKYGEKSWIKGYCPKGMSFADWVRSLRR